MDAVRDIAYGHVHEILAAKRVFTMKNTGGGVFKDLIPASGCKNTIVKAQKQETHFVIYKWKRQLKKRLSLFYVFFSSGYALSGIWSSI